MCIERQFCILLQFSTRLVVVVVVVVIILVPFIYSRCSVF